MGCDICLPGYYYFNKDVSSADQLVCVIIVQITLFVIKSTVPAALVVLISGMVTIVTVSVHHCVVETGHVAETMGVVRRGVDMIHMEAASKFYLLVSLS